jgi:hypothetical protein
MNKVKMIKSTYGVNDGQVYPTLFVEGEEYEIGARLLECFIEMGAIEMLELKAYAADENKAIKAAPENKSAKTTRKAK